MLQLLEAWIPGCVPEVRVPFLLDDLMLLMKSLSFVTEKHLGKTLWASRNSLGGAGAVCL